jgi:hypothetical protein
MCLTPCLSTSSTLAPRSGTMVQAVPCHPATELRQNQDRPATIGGETTSVERTGTKSALEKPDHRRESKMQRLRFPIAVALTSLGLVALLVVAGGLLVSSVLARGPWAGGASGPWSRAGAGGPWAGGHGPWGGSALPAQLAGLRDVPAAERFDHFKGVQVNLADKDGQPLVVTLTPGTATAASATTLTVAANDGASRTFALDAQTAIRGSHAQGGAPAGPPSIAQGDKLVVVTVNGSGTAAAVWTGNFGGGGPGGPFAH